MTHTIPIKPISANALYRNVSGRGRAKTRNYIKWETDAYILLPMVELPDGSFGIRFVFGTPYYNSADLDNMTKSIVDVMQKKWGFDDVRINRYDLTKKKVKRGLEYIEFEILA